MMAKGTMLGSGAVVALDDTVPVVEAALKIDEFFKHESCGKCTPCREGTHFLVKVWERIGAGHGRASDIPLLKDLGKEMLGNCFCPLGDSAVSAVSSTLKYFEPELRAQIESGRPIHANGHGVEAAQVEALAKRG